MSTPRAVWIVLAMTLCACAEKGRGRPMYQQTITSPGTYKLDSSDGRLKMWADDGILQYEMRSGAEIVLRAVRRASMYQRCGIYWESMDRLWVASSDIGDAIWVRDAGRLREETIMKGSKWESAMPEEFCELTAPSLRTEYPACRK